MGPAHLYANLSPIFKGSWKSPKNGVLTDWFGYRRWHGFGYKFRAGGHLLQHDHRVDTVLLGRINAGPEVAELQQSIQHNQ